jgi:hypothetical protein
MISNTSIKTEKRVRVELDEDEIEAILAKYIRNELDLSNHRLIESSYLKNHYGDIQGIEFLFGMEFEGDG